MKRLVIAFLSLGLLSCAAQAQSYPSRPITIVVTAAAGGVSDVLARAIGQRLTEKWGETIVIENKGGAGHNIGATFVANAKPDGYTLMVGESGTFVSNPTLYAKAKLPYDAEKSFTPITGLARIVPAFVAKSSLPVNSIKELLDLAKSKPGQITFSTAGIGSGPHMYSVLLEHLGHVKLNAVHYRGAAPALRDVVAGHVDLMATSVTLALAPYRGGKAKLLAVGSAKRIPELPDIPAVSETLPDYQAGGWFGMFAPAGTPDAIVKKINADVQAIFAEPEFQARFLKPRVLEPIVSSPEKFVELIKIDAAKWSKVIRAEKISID